MNLNPFNRRRQVPSYVESRYGGGTSISDQDERDEVIGFVDRISAAGVDSGTGAAIDSWIQARNERWSADIDSYCERAMEPYDEADEKTSADLARRHRAYEPAERCLRDADQTLTAARRRLDGGRSHGADETADTDDTADWQRTAHPGPDYAGYANPALGHRSAGVWLYGGLLALAAGADLVAFYQVMALILRNQVEWAVFAATIGFTAVALGLAHLGGRFHRSLKAGAKDTGPAMLWIVVVAWTILGIGAFILRVFVAEPRSSIQIEGNLLTPGGSEVAPEELWGRALVLLILYVATGAIAYLGAYILHNPVLADYARARRDYRRAGRTAARLEGVMVRARSRHEHCLQARERERKRWQYVRDREKAHSEELMALARQRMAEHIKNASATTGLTVVNGEERAHPDREQR